MSDGLKAITDRTFTLAESEDPNVFYFYRNDREVIGDVGEIPMDFYQEMLCQKMFNGEITEEVGNKICFETSKDGKRIRLTVSGNLEHENANPKKQLNFFKGGYFLNFFK